MSQGNVATTSIRLKTKTNGNSIGVSFYRYFLYKVYAVSNYTSFVNNPRADLDIKIDVWQSFKFLDKVF